MPDLPAGHSSFKSGGWTRHPYSGKNMQHILKSPGIMYNMTAVTHQLIALTAALWLLTIFPQNTSAAVAIISVFAVMIGALTPDLDHPSSNFFSKLLGARIINFLFRSFSGGHRHFTHSVLGIILIGLGLNWLFENILSPAVMPSANVIWLAFMTGYVSHVAADTLTDRGVPWLWPVHVHFALPPGGKAVRVTTGSIVETFLLRSALIIIIILLLQSRWQFFTAFFT